MTQKIILKLGGAIVTKKYDQYFPTNIEDIEKNGEKYIRIENIERFGKEISESLSESDVKLVLINGAGPFGHYLVERWDDLEYNEVVHDSVEYLNGRMIEVLNKYRLDIEPVSPFESSKEDGYNINELWGEGENILESDRIFSTYGDIVPDRSKFGYRVVSGDELAKDISHLFKADKIIMATDVDGVFDTDPKKNTSARIINKIYGGENVEFSPSQAADVTGAMGGKVDEMLKSYSQSQIINGDVPGNIKKAVLGDGTIGTLIIPSSANL